ncbi:hypothetical protein L7F22_035563 [Adiantum nelumboides]|nr:hypothetical protein [Adiantum nelumboides]
MIVMPWSCNASMQYNGSTYNDEPSASTLIGAAADYQEQHVLSTGELGKLPDQDGPCYDQELLAELLDRLKRDNDIIKQTSSDGPAMQHCVSRCVPDIEEPSKALLCTAQLGLRNRPRACFQPCSECEVRSQAPSCSLHVDPQSKKHCHDLQDLKARL